ncbi:DeoR family transcriptional regulator [Dactylosporangium darangshiense]|uniref:HTH deoR-type domain-containing protein n=1 Tax=Dactylosporangium darangshiense TaxID=579108 RepID=A0ABP8DH32_9ACTN
MTGDLPPDERVLAANRHRQILQLLAEHEYVTIGQIRDATGASNSTVSRDLSFLAGAGAIHRIRGGATRPAGTRDALDELRAHLAGLSRPLRHGDLDAVQAILRQALAVCDRVRLRQSAGSAR